MVGASVGWLGSCADGGRKIFVRFCRKKCVEKKEVTQLHDWQVTGKNMSIILRDASIERDVVMSSGSGCEISIDGKTYRGKTSVTKRGDHIYVDGVRHETTEDRIVTTIIVNGDVHGGLDTHGATLEIKGSAFGTLTSGDVTIYGDVSGDVSTINGDLECGNVRGNLTTVNGDINTRSAKNTLQSAHGSLIRPTHLSGRVNGPLRSRL